MVFHFGYIGYIIWKWGDGYIHFNCFNIENLSYAILWSIRIGHTTTPWMSPIPCFLTPFRMGLTVGLKTKKERCILQLLNLRSTDQGVRLIWLTWKFLHRWVTSRFFYPHCHGLMWPMVGLTRLCAKCLYEHLTTWKDSYVII